jgi:predicted ribosome quality control (RQC) complex YloA/Tae2 family protein
MALNAEELTRVVDEIASALRGGWIQAIHQPTDSTLVFEIRVPGRTHRLLVCCDPHTARLHLITRKLPNPEAPPPFCRFLRAHLQGARIEEIRQVPSDRIVELALASQNGPRTLACVLTGNTANLLVLDSNRIVLSALHHLPRLAGYPYVPPVLHETGRNSSVTVRFSERTDESQFPVSEAVESHYHDEEARRVDDRARGLHIRQLKTALKKTRRRIEAWEEDLSKAERFREYARYGELLKANLASIKKGTHRITLIDYFDAAMPEVTIPLEPDKSPRGNMDDYFRKHRKYLAAGQELKPRIERAQRELATLQLELAAIEQGTGTPPTPASPTLLATVRTRSRAGKQSGLQRREPFRRFMSSDGLSIFVGRNARENDELTFRLAKSDDLWFHARGVPGSHVVVRLERGQDAPAETLQDAAVLALLYSDLKKSGKGDVIYTRRKWVKKARGQAPGAVIVTQEKSLRVRVDKIRLTALKERADRLDA